MKVGDKVFVEVEVATFGDIEFITTENDRFEIKRVITQLPIQEGRWMMVSGNKESWYKRFVVGKNNGMFVAWQDSNYEHLYNHWKYAKEIPTKRKLTMQEIAEKFGEDVENIEICQ